MSAAAWMEQAADDLAAAKILSAAGHHPQAIWLAAQAVEKAHKAILFALGLGVQTKDLKGFSHDVLKVVALLPQALQDPPDADVARARSTLQQRAELSRYPELLPGQAPTVVAPKLRLPSSEADVRDAEMLVRWCKERLARAGRAVAAMGAPNNNP